MSNKAINWAKKLPLSRGEKNLLVMLANSLNDKTGYCCPTNRTLSKWCSCSERTTRRYIKALISKNLIQKEEVRDPLGRRVTFKYTLNFEQDLNSLPDKNACGQLQSLPDILTSLPDKNDTPTGHFDRKDYIINKNKTKIKLKDFSLDDENEQQKLEIIIGVKFEELGKVYGDTYDLANARGLHKRICLESKRSLQFAENLLTARKQQKLDSDKLTQRGKFVAAPCSLTNWLSGKRWLDIIKPLGEKKKVSPYVKCKCGEEFLKGTTCRRCEELAKPRLIYA